jgi:hypothetical protein
MWSFGVPNAPCGVESKCQLVFGVIVKFLMHRVELKAITGHMVIQLPVVPNAPCGVESTDMALPFRSGLFLMHRVELKAYSVLYCLSL